MFRSGVPLILATVLLGACGAPAPPRPDLDALEPGPILLYSTEQDHLVIAGGVGTQPPREARLLMTGGRGRGGRISGEGVLCSWQVGWSARFKLPPKKDRIAGDHGFAVALYGREAWRLASLQYAGCFSSGCVTIQMIERGEDPRVASEIRPFDPPRLDPPRRLELSP